MKKIISTFIAFLLATSLQAEIIRTTVNLPFENGTIKVEVVLNSDGNVATIGTGYNACIPQYAAGKMHIPSTVTHNNTTYTVTAIAPVAFRFCTRLTEVEIDEGVTTIGNYAFVGCLDMEAISLPSTVTQIGGGAFCKLPNLKEIKCAATTPPTWRWYDVFQVDGSTEGRNPDLKLYVPESSTIAYQAAKNDYSWTCMNTSTTPYTWNKTETRSQVGWGSYFDVIRSLEQWDVDHSISIYTVDDLINFRNKVNSGTTYNNYVVKLEADLDLTGVTWTPIGRVTKENDKFYDFYGTFDGQGHTISNLTIGDDGSYTSDDGHNNGLFGGTRNATVKNLIMENATIKGNYFVGAVIAHAQARTTVENVLVKNSNVTGRCFTGGIIGGAEEYNDGDCELRMNGCVVEGGSVTSVFNECYDGESYFCYTHPSWGAAGGLIGFAQYAWFTNCANLQTKVTWSSEKVETSSLTEYIDRQVCRGALVGYQDEDVPTGQKSMAYCYAHLHSENSLTREDYLYESIISDLDSFRLYGNPKWWNGQNWSRDTDKVAAKSDKYDLKSMKLQTTLTTGNPGQWAFHGDELPWPAYFAYKAYGDLDPSTGYVVYLPYGITINKPNYLTIGNNTSSQYDDPGNTYTTDSLILPSNIQGYDYQLPIGKVQITALNGVVNRRKLTASQYGTQEVTTVHPVYARDEDNMLILDPHGNPVQATNHDGTPMTESVTETVSLYTPKGYSLYLPYTTTLTGNCKLYQPTAWNEVTSRITFTRVENNVVQAYQPYYVIVEEGEVSLNTGTATVIGVEPADNGVIHIDGGSVTLDFLGNINDRYLQPQTAYQYTLGENRWPLVTSGVPINSWSAYFIANKYVDSYVYMDLEDNTFIELAVTGHGDSGNGGWAFISSPVEGSIEPSEVENLEGWMVQNGPYNYDLYRFNQSANLEWENYHKHDTEQDPFKLVNGHGYLYARNETRTLTFRGTFNTDNTKTVDLIYDTDAPFAGWNLVGNPFPVEANVSQSYYKMNESGTDIEAELSSGPVAPCTGIMVQATAEGQNVTFDKSGGAKSRAGSKGQGGLQLTVAKAGTKAVEDKAIVSFDKGEQLGKFIFNKDNAKLYFAQQGHDYAIAYSDQQGEMPLNFKAATNGEYTITVSPENVELGYLHLIDNLTGTDVDLLQTPEYTFDARTSDYASRFRLVFSNCEDAIGDDGAFAYVSNGEIRLLVETCHGASLQVVDMTGRVIRNCTDVARNVSTNGMTPGVYALRLINGNDVKTQKIVIE